MIESFLEILFCFFLIYLFIRQEKPNLKFLFLGFSIFFISLIFQIPFKYLEYEISKYVISGIMPSIILSIWGIIISEIIKYFSLKRYLKKTRSFKNAILFGLGWVSLESISIISIYFYTLFFSVFSISLNLNMLTSQILPLWNFIFVFVVNLGITILIIFSVIKKKKIYLFSGILFAIIVYVTLLIVNYKIFFEIFFILYSLFLLFKYIKIK